jgi:hypothetical protein
LGSYEKQNEEIMFNNTELNKSFKWMLFLNKKFFLFTVIDHLPFVMIKKILEFFFLKERKYFNFFKKKYGIFVIKNLFKKCLINYLDIFFYKKFAMHNFDLKNLFKIRIFLKYLLKQTNQVKVFSLYFLNFIELSKPDQKKN